MSAAASLAELIVDAGERGTVVFTGAGVSTESGIPDFRSPGGIWTRYAPIEFRDYVRDPAMRAESWRRGMHTYPPIAEAEPNGAHRAIADWWHAGLLNGVVTQNIDGLHQKAGVPDEAVVELHGNAHWVACMTCSARFDRPTIHARVDAGEADPACPVCGGILKSTTISFGQALPVAAVEEARRLHATARLCLIVGSSLVVYPAAALPDITLEVGGRIAIVNKTETHLDEFATVLIRDPAASVLQDAAEAIRAGLRR
ncbi:MAG: Sir2 family NAD-dependent protein deacetylase [Chloroflexi bacterium]|nr:Sir2 family NAD-dependent protein deacetylase [Chloroflexota bacterium]